MKSLKVPDLNERLQNLKKIFENETRLFKLNIEEKTERFTKEDQRDFDILLEEIKKDVMRRLDAFITEKITKKSVTFESSISTYVSQTQQLEQKLQNYSRDLHDNMIILKQKEARKEEMLEVASAKFVRLHNMRKSFKILKDYQEKRIRKELLKNRMRALYSKNLLKKSFFPWRTICYKDGYENFVKRQTNKDIMNIHSQFKKIMEVLERKIYETDEMIKVKKAAKGEFAYALSKNLLKTISNLSLEVMSLNQVTLRDQMFDESQTRRFMSEINQVIKEKLTVVQEYRTILREGEPIEREIEETNQVSDKKKQVNKGKRISFVD